MTTPPTCPKCGKPLPASAPQQLCPECLLRAGFPTGRQSMSGSAGPERRNAFTPPAPAELAPLFPQLEIFECIGQGGMGAVYRARQPALDRLVALKILRPPTGDDPGFAERFTREARALAKLSHPNIVAVHDYGEAGTYHYLLMEFVDGMNLRQLLNAGTISPNEALAIVPPICDALQFAHDQGIVHRDIKPENILLGKNGAVKIADFGLAKLAGASGVDASLTGAGDVMGTPHYMAPEQVEKPREVDHRADIYSLGVVFYQMLTGELPLGRFGPPSRKVQIDVRLDEIVLRALEKEPELRYQQASGLKTAVETVAKTSPPLTEDRSTNARADGNLLVVPVENARLPLRCIKTNKPVTAADLVRKEFSWFPPIIWLSLLLTPVAFVILYYFLRQQVTLDVPLSAAARRQIRRHSLFSIGLAAIGAVEFVIVIMNAYTDRWAGLGGGFFALLVLLGLAAMIAGLSDNFSRGTVLRAENIMGDRLWFSGASPAFLASLPQGGVTATPTQASGLGPRALIAVTLLLLLVLPATLWLRSRPGSERQSRTNARTTITAQSVAKAADFVRPAMPTKEAVATPTDFDRMESNPEILQVQLRLARQQLAYAEANYQSGVGSDQEVLVAKTAEALLKARLAGDRAAFARGQLDFAETRLKLVGVRHDAGLMTNAERDAAQAEVEIAKLRLRPVVSTGSAPPVPGAATALTDFDRMESNPEILQVQLRLARQTLADTEARYQTGVITKQDLLKAQRDVALLQARLTGDRVEFARVKLAAAEDRLQLIRARYDAGLTTAAERDAAQAEVEIARLRLREVTPAGSKP